jgi:uncharacterized damage-inducible protein DinB
MLDDHGECRLLRRMAKHARLANRRLGLACNALGPGEWEATRTSFFPSLRETMIHLLNADRYYVDAFRGDKPAPAAAGERRTAWEFSIERATVDDWIVVFTEGLNAADLETRVAIPWPDRTLSETLADTLLHVFLHGQHHRGQIHAMLSGSSIAPPQIDEFTLAGDEDARASDLAALGWSEAAFFR